MQKKILFTDMDGTLLSDEKTISPALYNALDAFHAKGHILVLSSGRPLQSIEEVRSQLQLDYPDTYIISYNGSLIYDCTRQLPILEKTISLTDAALILEHCHALGIHCHTYENEHIICEHESKELIYYRRHIHLPYLIVSDITNTLRHRPYKLLAIHLTDHALLERLQKEVLAATDGRITAVFSNDYYLEFFPGTSGKGNAVLSLCEYLGIPLSDAAAIGDEANDISMIRAAGLGCAMANARDEVKKEADYITTHDNNHDGLCDLLQFFFS